MMDLSHRTDLSVICITVEAKTMLPNYLTEEENKYDKGEETKN